VFLVIVVAVTMILFSTYKTLLFYSCVCVCIHVSCHDTDYSLCTPEKTILVLVCVLFLVVVMIHNDASISSGAILCLKHYPSVNVYAHVSCDAILYSQKRALFLCVLFLVLMVVVAVLATASSSTYGTMLLI
jgi:hypothetical protein